MASIGDTKPVQCDYLSSTDSMPVLFVKTLFEPFLFSPQTYWNTFKSSFKESVKELKDIGTTGIVRRINQAFQNHFVDGCALAGSIILSHSNIPELSPLVVLAVVTTNAVNNTDCFAKKFDEFATKTFVKLIGSKISGSPIKSLKISERTLEKVISWIIYAGFSYYAASAIAPAAALSWNSVSEAKEYYSGGPCTGVLSDAIGPSSQCLKDGELFENCLKRVPSAHPSDAVVFTQHESGVVTIVELSPQRVCYLAAKDINVPVVKTCFNDVQHLQGQTVELLPQMTLKDAYKGLPKGMSVQHIAVHSGGRSCATFNDAKAEIVQLENPKCILTSPEAGGDVIQTCLDPQYPSSITVKPLLGLHLNSPNGGPISIVIDNPELLGLNPAVAPEPENPCKCDPDYMKSI